MKVVYSWILPVKNEAESLSEILNEIRSVMGNFSSRGRPAFGWEIIAVNDASTDDSLITLNSLISQIPQLQMINLKTHQGKWAALLAGFKASKGQIIITLDSDLQDDPAEIIKLLNKFGEGYDLVSGWRKIRQDSTYKVVISRLGNSLASTLTSHNFHDLNSPFKIYRREVLENLPKQGSMLRFTMLFADKLGYKVIEVPIKHRPRLYGKSKFGFVKYLRIIYDLVLILLLFSGSGKLLKSKL